MTVYADSLIHAGDGLLLSEASALYLENLQWVGMVVSKIGRINYSALSGN